VALTACSLADNTSSGTINSKKEEANQNITNNSSGQPKVDKNTPKQAQVKKFYPDPLISSEQASSTTKSDIAQDDLMPENLQIKLYLVDKYKPGTCYGMPGPVPDEAISGMIKRNQSLAKFVKDKYKLKSDLEIYLKIKQIFGIQLEPASGGKYQYNFIDGQCCTLKSYNGLIENIGGKISDSVINQETKNNPC